MKQPKQPKPMHSQRERAGGGRYSATPPCDACGRSTGAAMVSDDEVCGSGDGPGFYLCDRLRCSQALEGITVDQRRAHYEAQRMKNKAAELGKSGPLA